ncbi:plastid ribosomal protein S6 [Chloropicon primus]|uniref:Plastid ribosomal protein S6 n=2 Tax=Chloropicon primus TaxID=1764295 RepID=A0A5B8MQ62_9CHLO|nr:plastid ribosomal protein S6 [Chloropicon primus]|mmetsp:Transcript_28920/g.60974  ORF Transcript_28920/g.60974 Transcript_28920/m.60974 type:complete len:186 (+) Transcript_28920:218-775(+)|eukprot:QDZ22154.1 plastid ribosomal protein S6 [Chloropicon primus]
MTLGMNAERVVVGRSVGGGALAWRASGRVQRYPAGTCQATRSLWCGQCSRVGGGGRGGASALRLKAAADVAATSDLPASWTSPPRGFKVYETMIIYNPDAQDAEREDDIQAFQDTLTSLGALDIAVSYENVPQRMAYPIEGYNVGIYVLFMYSAPASAAKTIQGILAAPSIEKEKTILRFMTTRA